MPSPDQEAQAPTTTVSTHDQVATHVESILRAIIKAINTKQFDSTIPPWTSVAANYRVACPHFQTPSDQQQTPQTPKPAWIQSLEDFSLANPSAHIIIDYLTSTVSQNSGHAKVFMNCRVTGGPGFPSGTMSKPTMSMYEFQFMEELGRWMFVRETTASGTPACGPCGEARGVIGEGLED